MNTAIAVLWLAVLAAAAPAAWSAEDFATHLASAVEARDTGDFEAGVAAAGRALALRPDSVEALRLHGTLLAFLGRHDEGLASLEQARGLDPENIDVRLTIARVRSWSGDREGAAREVAAIRGDRPENREARRLEARLLYFDGQLAQSEALLNGLVEQDPEDPQSLELLGDVLLAQGRPSEAGGHYRRAVTLGGESPVLRDKLERSRERPWRIDANYLFSTFRRQDRQDWHEGFVQLTRSVGADTEVFGRVEPHERFGAFDLHLALGASHRATDWLSGYLEAGVTPKDDFLARWAIAAGAGLRVRQGGDAVGATVATLDYRRQEFRTGGVDTISTGIEQYLAAGRLWLTGRLINTLNEDRDHTLGWLARADWQVLGRLRVFAGAADSPETVSGETVDTRSYFGGLVVDLDDTRSLRLDYLFDDREDSYIRHAVGATITQRF